MDVNGEVTHFLKIIFLEGGGGGGGGGVGLGVRVDVIGEVKFL